jgi:hypothetical protein
VRAKIEREEEREKKRQQKKFRLSVVAIREERTTRDRKQDGA